MMFCHRLTWNAWMSAFCAGGPVYCCVVTVVVCWFTVVGAPPEELQAARAASMAAAAATVSARRASNWSMALLKRLCMLGAPLRPRAGGSGLLEHLLEVVAAGGEARSDRGDRRPIGAAHRGAEAHCLEHLGDLTLCEGGARGELESERCGAVAAAGERRGP